MTVDAESGWAGRTGARSIDFVVDGASVAACLSRAVECFADAVADVHPSAVGEEVPVTLVGATPGALLLAVLEECMRCGHDGRIAIGFVVASHRGDTVEGRLRTVPGDDPYVVGAPPAVVSWHEVSLEPAGGSWRGRVVAR